MALSKDKKWQVIEEVSQLLADSKLTVFAGYSGTSVKDMQQLRRQAKANGTIVKVVKNRLFKKALAAHESLKSIKLDELQGQMLYAFNAQDEVAPAQDLAKFSSAISPLKFAGGLTADGQLLSVDDIQMLAELPSKQQLQAQFVGLTAAPISSVVGALAANLRSVINVLNARAETAG